MGEKKTIAIKLPNINIWKILIIFSLVLALVNLYLVHNLFSITGRAVEGGKAAQPQPIQPTKVQVSVDDDPSKGSKNAKVTIVEFSDFQCPFCARFWRETLPQIEKEYIKTGKVLFVYRDFPLSFHQFAQKAAEAAECSHDQGKFWEYHDKLYGNQNALDIASLKQYAKDLGLDMVKFNECLDSGKYASEVQKDFQDGIFYGVEGTPTFFINGIRVVGAQPYSVFKQIIEQALAS